MPKKGRRLPPVHPGEILREDLLKPPTGMLGGVLMGKVRDGIETGVKMNLETARDRLAAAK